MLPRRDRAKKFLKRLKLSLARPRGSATPLFIFGMQRSGTNMLSRVFFRNRETECFYEADEEAFDDYRLRPEATIARLISRSHARIVLFKPLSDSQHATRILDTYPGAKGIWIYRHFDDVANSASKLFPKFSAVGVGNMIHRPEQAGWRVENVAPEDMELVRRLEAKGPSNASAHALFWYLRNRLYYQQGLDKDPRVLLVNYERLVSDPLGEFARIARFAGIEARASDTGNVFSSSVGLSKPAELDEEVRGLCESMYERLEATLQAASDAADGTTASEVEAPAGVEGRGA